MLDMDHKLGVKHDQGPIKVMYEARTNEQRLSKPDHERINDGIPLHNCSEDERNLCRNKQEKK